MDPTRGREQTPQADVHFPPKAGAEASRRLRLTLSIGFGLMGLFALAEQIGEDEG